MRKVTSAIAGVSLIASLALNGYFLFRPSGSSDALGSIDAPWASKALRYRADQEHVPVDAISRLNRASVIYFTNQVCVGLSPSVGVAGGRSVVCFDVRTGKVLKSEAVGE